MMILISINIVICLNMWSNQWCDVYNKYIIIITFIIIIIIISVHEYVCPRVKEIWGSPPHATQTFQANQT